MLPTQVSKRSPAAELIARYRIELGFTYRSLEKAISSRLDAWGSKATISAQYLWYLANGGRPICNAHIDIRTALIDVLRFERSDLGRYCADAQVTPLAETFARAFSGITPQ